MYCIQHSQIVSEPPRLNLFHRGKLVLENVEKLAKSLNSVVGLSKICPNKLTAVISNTLDRAKHATKSEKFAKIPCMINHDNP